MKLQLNIGGDSRTIPGERHCEIKLGNYGFSAGNTEYLSMSGICKPERAAVLALAFEMRDAIDRALDESRKGNNYYAETILDDIQRECNLDIRAAKDEAAK